MTPYAATALFLANFALVRFGMVDTKPFRWLHHALFFAVFVAALALGVGYLQGAPYRWALLLVLLVVVPRVRAGTTGHAALTSFAMFFYATGSVSLL